MAKTPKTANNTERSKSSVAPLNASTSRGRTSGIGSVARTNSGANPKRTSASKAKETKSKQSTSANSRTPSKKPTSVEEPTTDTSSENEDEHQDDPPAPSSSEAEDSDWDEEFPRIFRRRFRGATPPPMPGYRGNVRSFCEDDGGPYEILTLKDVDKKYRHLLKKYF